MPKENNKMQVDIDTLKKQNVNDLLSIKELYSKLEELGEKTTQIKYIDNTLVKKIKKEYEKFKKEYEKFKKEYEKLKKIILDENIQIKLTNDIETINSKMNTKLDKSEIYQDKHYLIEKTHRNLFYFNNDGTHGEFSTYCNDVFKVDGYYKAIVTAKTTNNFKIW